MNFTKTNKDCQKLWDNNMYLFEKYFTKKDQDTPPTLEEVIAENYDPNQPLGDETNEIRTTD